MAKAKRKFILVRTTEFIDGSGTFAVLKRGSLKECQAELSRIKKADLPVVIHSPKQPILSEVVCVPLSRWERLRKEFKV